MTAKQGRPRISLECGRNHGMSEELEVLKEVTRRLDRAKIAYMVTGSIATNLYTIPRMTRDIDIVVELSVKDLSRFIPRFEADYYLDPETVRDVVKSRGMFNLIHDEYIDQDRLRCA